MASRAADFEMTPPTRRPGLTMIAGAPVYSGGRYGEDRRANWPVIGAIAAAHLALGALLMVTGTIHLARADKPVVVRMIPDTVEPSSPPQPEVTLDQIPVEVIVPDVLVETPPSSKPLLTVTTVPPAAKPALQPSVAVTNPGPVAAPVTPPDFDADQLNNAGPRYPAMSRRNHEQGTATLKVLVSPNGRAQELAVAATSGFRRLDDAALETVRRWKFLPAKQAGKAVSAWVLVPVTFALG